MNDGKCPAFPRIAANGDNYPGMSLRDYFAAKAMQSFLRGDPRGNILVDNPNGRKLTSWIAESAYDYADAMLEAREK